MAHKLVIVESPAKARTIGGYLGAGYVVESSIGHIRDLPQNAADTPAKIKDKPWGRLAVDVENDFEPYYVVPRDKKAHITKLKRLLKDADELYLATDEDREGEAIAWHLLDELKPKGIPVKRMVFHEITKPAILAAAENPRDLDMDLVEAQEARRILDRLYGYEVSPGAVEEGHVRPLRRPRPVRGDPAGRRPRAGADGVPGRRRTGTSRAPSTPARSTSQRMFPARLHSVDGARVARGSDFGADGAAHRQEASVVHLDRSRAEALVDGAARHDVRRPVGRGEALPPLAVRAVPHHHPAAGGVAASSG